MAITRTDTGIGLADTKLPIGAGNPLAAPVLLSATVFDGSAGTVRVGFNTDMAASDVVGVTIGSRSITGFTVLNKTISYIVSPPFFSGETDNFDYDGLGTITRIDTGVSLGVLSITIDNQTLPVIKGKRLKEDGFFRTKEDGGFRLKEA